MPVHSISPVYNQNSKVLILGSFPSVKSREASFYYAHPQNRFWQIISRVCRCDMPDTVDSKKELLLQNGIALWDVIESCEIVGSSDSSIKNVKANNISKILNEAEIKHVFTNGKKADELYKKHVENAVNIKAVCLPSTSPANAAWGIDRLFEQWNSELCKYIR